MKEKFTNFIDKEMCGNTNYMPYFIIFGIIIGLILSIPFYKVSRPTSEDYQTVIESQNLIIQNFDNIYSLDDFDITTSDGKIVASINSNSCCMKMYFDNNKTYLYSEKADTNAPLFLCILFFVLTFGLLGFWAYSIILLICFAIYLMIIRKKKDN